MEGYYMVLGIAMVYALVHSIVIISKKIENLTQYEGAVLIVGLVTTILMFFNIITS